MNEAMVNKIYWTLASFDRVIRLAPKEDVLQEIRFSLLVSNPETMYSVAQRNVRRLLREMGFDMRMQNKRAIDRERLLAIEGLSEKQASLIEELYEKYVCENMTHKQICTDYNIQPTEYTKHYFSIAFGKDRKFNKKNKTA